MSSRSWELSLWSSADDSCASGMSRRMCISCFWVKLHLFSQSAMAGCECTASSPSTVFSMFHNCYVAICFLRGFVLFLNLKKNALCTLGATLALSWGSETLRSCLDWKLSCDETCRSCQGQVCSATSGTDGLAISSPTAAARGPKENFSLLSKWEQRRVSVAFGSWGGIPVMVRSIPVLAAFVHPSH